MIEITATSPLHHFPGGIHPPEQKALANQTPIQRLPLAPMLYIPLRQHSGPAGELCVQVGDHVLKGQALTQPGVDNGLPVHASTSGTIVAIQDHPLNHPSGFSGPTAYLQPDGAEQWIERQPIDDISRLSHREILMHLQLMGIAGLGGAGFPTARKVAGAQGIDLLIINGVECEPYIVADDRLMREHAAEIVRGSQLLQTITAAKQVVIAVEDNKPEAIAAFETVLAADANVTNTMILRVVPTRYPSGGEKQLIQVLTGLQVPADQLPADIGILVQNVGTAFAVARAIDHGEPLIERVVTITGQALSKPGTAWIPLGTPIDHVLSVSGFQPAKKQRVIIGGPMMGYTIASLQVPVIKTTNCILAPSAKELAPPEHEMACIRCGACEQVCPASLLPQQLQWLAKAKDYDGLKQHHLADCIECGACAYVCPSEIPLVQYYRQAKAEIREQLIEQQKSEIARQRFEARQARLEREKEERLEKHRKAAEARKAAQAARADSSEEDPVKAALARVKAKKAAQQAAEPASESTDAPADDKKAQVAAAVARAKARKAEREAAAQKEKQEDGKSS